MSSKAGRRAQQKRENKQARRAAALGLLAVGTGAPLGAAVIVAPPADAASFSVTNNNDTGAGSLRAAVAAANASAGADTINVTTTGVITLASGEIEITDDVTITGPGAAQLTVNAGGDSRIFNIHPSSATDSDAVVISGLTLTAGQAPSYYNPFYHTTYVGSGGAVTAYSAYYAESGTLTLDHVNISSSSASNGGALMVAGEGLNLTTSTLSSNDALNQGGALRAFGGDVRITGSTLSSNTAVGEGGAIRLSSTDTTLIGSNIQNNTAEIGGGIASFGASLALEGSVISGNTADRAGGLLLYGFYSGPGSTVSDTLISGNVANYGGLYGGSAGGVDVSGSSSAPATFENVTIVGNTATGDGGGVMARGHVVFNGSTISGNTADRGGGVWSTGSTDTLRNSIVANNNATAAAERDLAVYDTAYQSIDVDYTLVEATPTAGTITDVTPGSNIVGQDPQLGALASNGGPTQTLKPAAASPVVDKGKSFGLTHDQRGRNRPVDLATANATGGDGADMGAVELSSATDVPPAQTVTNSVAPTVPTATPRVGVQVSSSPGTWTPVDATLSYQWYSGAAKITGATNSTYTPVAADAGNRLSVQVTGTKSGLTSTTVWSNQTGAVLLGDAHAISAPTISGVANPGSALVMTSSGSWTPAGANLTLQWLRNGAPIPGATGNFYLIGSGDLGTSISLRVTALAANYKPGTADSASALVTSPVQTPGTLVTSGTGSVTGKYRVGYRIKAVPPACAPAASVSYQWLRSGKAIATATKAKYKLKSADKGKKMSVRVTYTLAGYNTKVITIRHAGKVKG